MRILIVLQESPYLNNTGNNIIVRHHLELLSINHRINAVYPTRLESEPSSTQNMPGIKLIAIFNKKNKFSSLLKLWGLLQGLPLPVSAVKSPSVNIAINKLLSLNDFDVILTYGIGAIQFIPKSYYSITVANIEDPQTLRTKKLRQLSIWSFFEKARLVVYQVVNNHYEKKTLPLLAKSLVLSGQDAKELKEMLPNAKIDYVNYAVSEVSDDDILSFDNRKSKSIIFSGTMSHPANIDAAVYFIKTILPLVLKKTPTAIFWVVGIDPPKKIFDVSSLFPENIKITGKVDNISDYIKRSIVSVCPVRLPIGVQTKILEAMSLGTPVVSTAAGNLGIGGVSSRDLYVADEPESFAQYIADLMNGKNWEKISHNGLIYSRNHFSWKNSAQQMEKILSEINKLKAEKSKLNL